ncbi:probable transcription regulator [Lentisphaera araneosa HTCC2155]|uniref:Probable transcription regulator n=1 Tax=Lentisphaera araneosa HTCC2155 TaxID=313628 RepID=A6DPR0_9BACT|nr:AraC family transcriptional regulator [Lentisphaera araneosa]EDM26355.1 probable transcription regulator [Lentisphaera araneosa HTCC2155]
MNSFWEEVKLDASIQVLLNNLPGVQVFVKDLEGRFTHVNDEALQAYGASKMEDILGKTDHEVFGPKLAENYVKSDADLFREKVPQTNIIELVRNRFGRVEWVVTTKIPLFDHQGELMGLMGTSQNFGRAQKNLQPYLDIAPGVEYMENNYMKSFSVEKCADLSHLSVRQFERKFKKTFLTSPQDYIMKTRIQHACNYLLKSKMGISEIALKVGFYDQSVFTRQFKKQQGLTPGAYRKKFT